MQMKVTGRRFSIGMLTLAFVLGFFVIAQSVNILNEMDYSEAGIPLWKGPWEEVPDRYRVYLKLDGKLSSIEYPDWGYGSEAFSEYSDAMVFETMNSEDNQVPKEVYFWDYEGKTGLIPAISGGDYIVGDTFLPIWFHALFEGWNVEVEGYAFDVMEGGKRLTLFDVEKLIFTEKTEALRMYKHVGVSTNFGGIAGESSIPLPLPTRFVVGRTHEDDIWQEYDYGLWLEEGETIRYIFDSSKPLRFQITYSNHVSFTDVRPDHILVEEPSIMAANAYFTAEWEGFYIFRFEGGDPASYVEFNALRKIGENVSMPAWIMGGKGGGGSSIRIPVNESDLSQFPHLLESFEAFARMTYCPASEAVRILKFFGEEYRKGIDWYGFKLVLEDGTMYHFGLTFGWIPPPAL